MVNRFAILLCAVSFSGVASADDSLVETLVTHSPWWGSWQSSTYMGAADQSFGHEGRLEVKFESAVDGLNVAIEATGVNAGGMQIDDHELSGTAENINIGERGVEFVQGGRKFEIYLNESESVLEGKICCDPNNNPMSIYLNPAQE